MTSPTPRADIHDEYLQHNLMLVRTGRKSRAPGIRHRLDCHEPYIDDYSDLPHCLTVVLIIVDFARVAISSWPTLPTVFATATPARTNPVCSDQKWRPCDGHS